MAFSEPDLMSETDLESASGSKSPSTAERVVAVVDGDIVRGWYEVERDIDDDSVDGWEATRGDSVRCTVAVRAVLTDEKEWTEFMHISSTAAEVATFRDTMVIVGR